MSVFFFRGVPVVFYVSRTHVCIDMAMPGEQQKGKEYSTKHSLHAL